MITQIYAKKWIKLFGEIAIAKMIKEFKKLDEGVIPGKLVVITSNPDEITDTERMEALETVNLINRGGCDHQG